MNIRPPKFSDIYRIRELHSKFYESEFPFPNTSSVASAVIEEDNVVKGFGALKIIAEPILIIDKNLSTREKVLLFKLMLSEAIKNAKICNISQMYISVADEDFAEILKKHYGFSEIRDKSLVLNL